MGDPIVVGVDVTADSMAALAKAADLAGESAAPVIAVHVRHEPGIAAMAEVAGEAAAMDTTLDEVEAITREQVTGVMTGRRVDWRLEVAIGDVAGELVKTAARVGAGTIVVGGRHHGMVGGLVLGSVAQKLVRKSPVSVLVVRDGHADQVNGAPGEATPSAAPSR